MAAADTQLRTNFLSDAAHILRDAAPETSAYLMSECAEHLARQGTAVSDIYRQHVCTACGHIMIPGHATKLKLETRRLSRRNTTSTTSRVGGTAASPTGPCKTLTCGHCQSVTRIKLPAPEKATRSKAPERRIESISKTAIEKPKPAVNANASSKKRAKNRKAGLQALLSSQQKPSGGLSLASFMK